MPLCLPPFEIDLLRQCCFFFDFHGSETLSYVWYYHENHDTMIKSFSWKLKYQACEDLPMCCGLHVLSCHHRHCHWQVFFAISIFVLRFIHLTCKEWLFFISPLVKNWQNKLAIFVSLLHLWHIPSFLLSLINFPSYQKLFSQYFFFAKRKILFPIRYCEQANITIIPRLTDCWNIVDINETSKHNQI